MASQNPKDWEFSLAHLLDDPIQFFQPSISRWCVRDEAETFECRIQPFLDLDPKQLSLTSLKNLQPDAKALVIILEAEAMLIGSHQLVFEGCFQNTNEGQMVNYLFDEVSYRFWLQGPVNYLSGERQANYITTILQEILEFLYVWTI